MPMQLQTTMVRGGRGGGNPNEFTHNVYSIYTGFTAPLYKFTPIYTVYTVNVRLAPGPALNYFRLALAPTPGPDRRHANAYVTVNNPFNWHGDLHNLYSGDLHFDSDGPLYNL